MAIARETLLRRESGPRKHLAAHYGRRVARLREQNGLWCGLGRATPHERTMPPLPRHGSAVSGSGSNAYNRIEQHPTCERRVSRPCLRASLPCPCLTSPPSAPARRTAPRAPTRPAWRRQPAEVLSTQQPYSAQRNTAPRTLQPCSIRRSGAQPTALVRAERPKTSGEQHKAGRARRSRVAHRGRPELVVNTEVPA